MGYFSNGTEGDIYEETHCARCANGDEGGAGNCAVWLAHLLYAYGADGDTKHTLDVLIPRAKDGGGNQRCAMWRCGPAMRAWSRPARPR